MKLVDKLDVKFKMRSSGSMTEVLFNGEIVTNEIRTETSGKAASIISPIAGVRKALLTRQRAYCKQPGLIADGRDMGTVVFPNAELKIFLTASIDERAKRRFKQLKERGISVNLRRLYGEIKERDERDSRRKLSPLKPADDAVIVDTTDISIEDVIKKISVLVIDKIPNLPKQVVDYLR
jgi:cytidylate kinase